MKSIKKSLKKSVIGISGIFLSLFLVSCTNNVSEVKDLELQTCYGKAVLGKIQFLEKTIDTVTKYVDINGSSRNAIAGDCDLLSIGEILPDDLSTLKRKKNSVSRNLNENIECEDISLKEELDELSKKYLEMIKENIPSFENIVGLEDVFIYDDIIYLGGGITVPINSLEGIATLEYLIDYAENGDCEKSVERIKEDLMKINEMYKENSSRALYLKNPILGFGRKWKDGVITYHWGDIYPEHKDALIKAMDTWANSCDNVISFKEISDTDWNKFLEDTSTLSVITFRTGALQGMTGLTSQIGQCKNGKLTIDKNISDDELQSTCLHELGHVLGLMHEHQKYVRDDYIVCDGVLDVSYETFIEDVNRWWQNLKFPMFLGGFVWKTFQIKILWWTIDIPYLEWSYTAIQVTNVELGFDFDSIMLYSGYEIKNPTIYQGKGIYFNGKYYTRQKGSLSSNDIKAVKDMYKKGN